MFAEIDRLNLDAKRRGRVDLVQAGRLQTQIVTQCILSLRDRLKRGEDRDAAIRTELASRWEIIARAGATIPTLRDAIRGALESEGDIVAKSKSEGSRGVDKPSQVPVVEAVARKVQRGVKPKPGDYEKVHAVVIELAAEGTDWKTMPGDVELANLLDKAGVAKPEHNDAPCTWLRLVRKSHEAFVKAVDYRLKQHKKYSPTRGSE